jgi:hypothetical protein
MGIAIRNCEVCGHFTAMVELPGRTDKCCASCARDVMTVILLHTEIEAARREGQDPIDLEFEAAELLTKVLQRWGLRAR